MTTRLPILALLALIPASISLASKPPAPYPGRPAPEAIFEDLLQAPNGSPLNIAELQGKVVVLEFWATWCTPCIEAIPHLNQLTGQFQKDIIFIAVTDEPREKIEPLLDQLNMFSWVACDTDRSVFKNFGVNQWPYTVVIDAEGVVAGITMPQFLNFDNLANVVRNERTEIGGGLVLISPGRFDWESPKDPNIERAVLLKSAVNEPTRFDESMNRATGMANSVMSYAMWAWDTNRARILVDEFDQPWRDLFDIAVIAKPPNDPTIPTQSLLQHSLGISIGWEEREIDALVLSRLDDAPHKLDEEQVVAPKISTFSTTNRHYNPEKKRNYSWGRTTVKGHPIDSLCEFIERYAWLPVIDETGLDGFYSWSLELAMTDTQDKAPIIEHELGLRLTREKRTVPMLVIKPRDPE